MSSRSSRPNIVDTPKSVASTSKTLPPNLSKVDAGSAIQFTELLRRLGEQETMREQEREIQASLQQAQEDSRLHSTFDENAFLSRENTPKLFYSTHTSSLPSQDEATTLANPFATGGVNSSSGVPMVPVDIAKSGNLQPAIEQIVESVFRNWHTQPASATGHHWAIQLSTGSNTTSLLSIEYTVTGEWRLKISGEAKSSGSASSSEEESEESFSSDWDHHQFCAELELCLKDKRPDIDFSRATHF